MKDNLSVRNMIFGFLFISILTLLVSCSSKQNNQAESQEQKTLIHVKNNIGEVEIRDDILTSLLVSSIGDIEGQPIIFTFEDFKGIAAACPFDNEVIISKDGNEINKFWIAGDGCYTVLKQDMACVKISEDIYNRLEKYMQEFKNALADHKRYKGR